MAIAGTLKSSPLALGLVRRVRRSRGRFVAGRLSSHDGVEAEVLGAIRAALNEESSAEERAWCDRIEAKRRELSTSTEVVEFAAFDGEPTPDRTVGKMTESSKPARWAYLLFRIVRAPKPASALELGACVGVSAAYQAAALELNGAGRLVSLEGVPALAERSELTQKELGLDERCRFVLGRFADTLPGVLDELGTIDYAFVDEHHQEKPTREYTELILAHARPGTVLVYDDLAHFPGVYRAWQTFQDDPRFGLMVDLRTIGIAVVGGRHELLGIPYA